MNRSRDKRLSPPHSEKQPRESVISVSVQQTPILLLHILIPSIFHSSLIMTTVLLNQSPFYQRPIKPISFLKQIFVERKQSVCSLKAPWSCWRDGSTEALLQEPGGGHFVHSCQCSSRATPHVHRWDSTDTFWSRYVAEVSRYSGEPRGMKSDQAPLSPNSSAPAVLSFTALFQLES